MKTKTKNILTGVFLTALIVLATLFGRSKVEVKQVEKQAVQDSLALLNRLLVLENQKYINVMIALDSISRKGGALGFTNLHGELYEIKLIKK